MELQVWKNDWGLPSFDHKCLAVMTYCKFCNIPVDFRTMNNPFKSPTGEFPVLKAGDETIGSKVNTIFNYFKTKNSAWHLDGSHQPHQLADITAFAALLERKLLPAMLHFWWVDTKCFTDFTRPWYAGILPFPLGLYLPVKKRNESISQLQATIGSSYISDLERETKILKDAKECLNLLDAKLGNNKYFFGNLPSSLDCLVFGYIATLEKAPIPSTPLKYHLKACPNLAEFCRRIINLHFPPSLEELEIQRKKEEESRHRLSDTTEFPNKRRNMLIAGAVVVAAMVGYSLWSGLISIEFVNVDKKLDDERTGSDKTNSKQSHEKTTLSDEQD